MHLLSLRFHFLTTYLITELSFSLASIFTYFSLTAWYYHYFATFNENERDHYVAFHSFLSWLLRIRLSSSPKVISFPFDFILLRPLRYHVYYSVSIKVISTLLTPTLFSHNIIFIIYWYRHVTFRYFWLVFCLQYALLPTHDTLSLATATPHYLSMHHAKHHSLKRTYFLNEGWFLKYEDKESYWWIIQGNLGKIQYFSIDDIYKYK